MTNDMGILPKCPESRIGSGEHELDYYDPDRGACSWCGNTAGRCPECSVLLELHHDPGCTQPCARCEAKPAAQAKADAEFAGDLARAVSEERARSAIPAPGPDLSRDVNDLRDWGGNAGA